MLKIGLSTCGFELTQKNFEDLAKSGIEAVEISMKADKYPAIDYAAVKRFADAAGVKLWSYHLPFSPFTQIDPSSLDKEIRAYTVDYFSELIKKGSAIGIDTFVVHASGEPIEESERAEHLKYSRESMVVLAEIADRCGARIAVEDLPRTCLGHTSEEILALVEADDRLRVCFDTNHLLMEDNVHFLRAVADKLVTVHVSDYDFINERHWLPGEGKVNWNELYNTFVECGYNGVWMYEISLQAPGTILRDHDLTFDDFVRNANCIFAGNTPAPVGKPKENLGMWG
ncbi:MAG: sugar phosphate isomerase/epimerase [Clostridia bacterium]|nr:sugar phosphate isomerase/epimerase [Clostridia bacterium]